MKGKEGREGRGNPYPFFLEHWSIRCKATWCLRGSHCDSYTLDVTGGWQGHRASRTRGPGGDAAIDRSWHATAVGRNWYPAAVGRSGHATAVGIQLLFGRNWHAAAVGRSGHAIAVGWNWHVAAVGRSGHATAVGRN